jgi:hypothetical protein
MCTDVVGGAPAGDEELAALVAATVGEQLGGEVQSWLEGEVSAERLGQGNRLSELGHGRLSGVPDDVLITAPAYWSAGGTSMQFFENQILLHPDNYWPFFLPGPGAVAVRPMG